MTAQRLDGLNKLYIQLIANHVDLSSSGNLYPNNDHDPESASSPICTTTSFHNADF